MTERASLRARLTLAYALALGAALVAFAAATLFVVDRLQRGDLDAQLLAAAQVDRAIADVSRGRLVVDPLDRRQFAAIGGTRVASAILDADGTIVTSTAVLVPAAIVAAAARASQAAFATADVGGDRLRLRIEPLLTEERRAGTIVVWRDAETIAQLDTRLGLLFALAIPLVVGAAMLVGGTIARRGLAPLDRMARIAATIEARDLTQRLRLPARNDELGRLAATFDRMLDRLQGAFERERRFTSDASHELRAPLSIILAETELALIRERDPAEYRRALETIALEADALENLTRSLLAAARAESGTSTRSELVEAAEIAENAARRIAPFAAAHAVRLDAELRSRALVAVDSEEVERAVLTVLHNAVKFARSHVVVELDADAANARVVIADDGPGFSDEALAHALERFWRDGAGNADGSGLGLAIARAIVERYGGTITLANRPGRGACVTLSLPAQPPGGASSS